MLKINIMSAWPRAGDDLSPGRGHLLMPGTDRLQALNSSNIVGLVRPEPLGFYNSLRRYYRAAVAHIKSNGDQVVAESL